MILRRHYLLVALLLAGMGCAEAPKAVKKKEPEKPPEAVTGRYAFHQMYANARAWAQDLEALQLTSIPLPEVKSENGKYGAWQVVFVSPGKGKAKTFTYSVIEAGGNLHQGVFGLQEEIFRGARGQDKPFLIQALRIDSDQAYETAVKKSAAYIKKNPDMPVTMQLTKTQRFPDPAWRVIWGASASSSNYSIFVDATTGDYLVTAH